VVACLPPGVIGKVSAAVAAKDMMRSFPIRVGLMVGLCGGVCSERADVRLGDIVVNQPDERYRGLMWWDYGKMGRDGPCLLHALGWRRHRRRSGATTQRPQCPARDYSILLASSHEKRTLPQED
jgi:hypothetical protein